MASTRSIIAPPPFAANALTVIPPTPVAGVSSRDPAAGPASSPGGWPYAERVNSAEFNQIMFQMSSLVSIMDKKGVLGWSSLVDYSEPSIQFGSDGFLYSWVQASGPNNGGSKDPISSPLYWKFLSSGRFIGVQKILVSGNYIPTPGMKTAMVEMVGGGGGSAHVLATGAGQYATTGGGGAGMYARLLLTSAEIGASVPCTIGSGGVGATAGGGVPSANGGATSFGTFGTVSGGARSTAGIVSAGTYLTPPGFGGSTFSGSATPINVKPGEPGAWGVYSVGSGQIGGSGGSSDLGGGGQGGGIGVPPTPGTLGSGGGGGAIGPNSASVPGTNGGVGAVLVWEFT